MAMRETTAEQRTQAQIIKAFRSGIRLRHTLMADEEIARRVPEFEKELERRMELDEGVGVEFAELYLREGNELCS